MAANSSSTPFFGMRQENRSQMITQQQFSTTTSSSTAAPIAVPQKKRRNQPGTPYPDAEAVALSPKSLMATNRFVCEVCNKGFQREQNLQLHRRGHNLPWKLKQKATKDQQPPKRKVYLCPEPTCVHHHPSRALGDLTGIKKHYSRKHGEKKWKCHKCSKKYAVQSDWKAHSKTCGTKEYRCDCGTLFSRRDSFITHRAFCDALAHETARHPSNINPLGTHNLYGTNHISLGLSQVGTQISQLQNQNQLPGTDNNSILSLGSGTAASAPKFEHLTSPPLHQSMSSPSSSAFFMTDPNQGFQDHHNIHPQHGPSSSFLSKQLHDLMQLPDLQGNTTTTTTNNNNNSTANLFNLSFFPSNNNNNSGSINILDQFSNISGGNNQGTTLFYTNSPVSNNNQVGSSGLSSSLFGNSSLQQESMSPHISATALLQKAAQMGSTTSTDGSSLLRGIGNGADSDRKILSNNIATFGSDSRREGLMRSSMETDQNHIRGIFMNTLANNGNTSIFGNVKGNQNDLGQFHSVEYPNKLTLDFLGIGGMVRNNMSGGGFSHKDQQHSMSTMSTSLDPKLLESAAAQTNQPFGSSKMQ